MNTTLRIAAIIGVLAIGLTAALWIFGVSSFSELQSGLGKVLGVIVVVTGVAVVIMALTKRGPTPPTNPGA